MPGKATLNFTDVCLWKGCITEIIHISLPHTAFTPNRFGTMRHALRYAPGPQRATSQGYRSQAAHKLAELDDYFHIFSSRTCFAGRGTTVVDLAAAPGGFAQVAVERLARSCSRSEGGDSPASEATIAPLVIAVDLQRIEPIDCVVSHRCSILNIRRVISVVRRTVCERDAPWPCVVMHDGVATGEGLQGFSSTYAQNNMALCALKIALTLFTEAPVLRKQRQIDLATAATGRTDKAKEDFRNSTCFVSKAMHSRHYNQVLDAARLFFANVDVWKPPSSRPTSRETYIVARSLRPSAVADYRRLAVNGGLMQNGSWTTPFSLAPRGEDVMSGRQAVWMCHQCEQVRTGCMPCFRCASP